MAKKDSIGAYTTVFLMCGLLFVSLLGACMDPIDVLTFVNDPKIKDIAEQVEAASKVAIHKGSDDAENLVAGNGFISGLTPGKYYMFEEYYDGSLTRSRFVKADGDHVGSLTEIGLLEGTQIINLKNSLTYKVTAAKPFDSTKTYNYFAFGDPTTKDAVVLPNGGVTTLQIVSSGGHFLDVAPGGINANKLYEVMMVPASAEWGADYSRTNSQYNDGGTVISGIGSTSYNNKYNMLIKPGVFQYGAGISTGSVPLSNRSILGTVKGKMSGNAFTEVEAPPYTGIQSGDYVFAEYSNKYAETKSVTNFCFVKVVVSATALPALGGSVSIDITTPAVGQTLTAVTTVPPLDYNGGTPGVLIYQWKSGGSNVGTNSSTYEVTIDDVGNTITVTVSNPTGNSGSVTSPPTAIVPAPALTGNVTIEITGGGTIAVGKTLTVNISALDGTGTPSYQWQRTLDGTTTFVDIAGETSNSYTVDPGDAGYIIRVTVSRPIYTGSKSSAATAVVPTPSDPPLTGTPIINGTTEVGDTLTSDISALNGTGTPSYQWYSSNTSGGAKSPITGATSATYTLVATDNGKYITLTVSNRAGTTGSVTSNELGPVTLPALGGTVTISGTSFEVGQSLMAVDTGLDYNGSTKGTLSYQWKKTISGSTYPISGATSPTYVLQSTDVGHTISVTISNSNNTGDITGSRTETVIYPALTDTVTITGANPPEVGKPLAANVTTNNGSGAITYQWKVGGVDAGTNSASYSPVTVDRGKTVTVTITRAENSGEVTSAATAAVTNPFPGTLEITNGATALVGETLAADTTSLGASAGTLSYKWTKTQSGSDTIVGTGSSYGPLVAGDVGAVFTLEVTSTGNDGNATATTIAVTDPSLPALGGSVSISGTTKVGQTLSAVTTVPPLDYNGGTPGSLTYQWVRNDTSTIGSGTNIPGATSATYLLVAADKGKYISVIVSNPDGNSGNVESATVGPITAATTNVTFGLSVGWTGGPGSAGFGGTGGVYTTISGRPVLDINITATNGTSFAWYYDGVKLSSVTSTLTGKYSLYTEAGYTVDAKWFQPGTHTITLITDKGSWSTTFTYP